jgi:GldL N-terminal domain
MAELSLQQVERIRKDLIRQSINYSHLLHDLLDHICCDIEFEMDRGNNFEEAYSIIKKWMGAERCRKIQEETLLLTNNTYRFMKSVMKITGIISPVLLAVAALFKVQHWAGAGIFMSLGFFLLGIFFLPSAIYVLYKENKGKRFFLYLFGLLSFLPLTAGVLFKVQHWPGAGLLITVGIGATVALFLPTLLYVKIKDSQRKDLNPVLTVGVVSGMIHILGLLFKIMHWPGATLMFFLGSMVFVLVFLPWYYYKVYKEKEFVTFEFIFLLVGVIWFILTSTLFNLNI